MNFDLNDLVNRLLKLDFSQVPLFLVDTLRNPQQNPAAFALLLGGITVILLLVIVLVALVVMSLPEDEEEYVEVIVEEPEEVVEEEVVRPRSPYATLISVGVWVLLLSLVWVVGGYVTRQDTVCLSCHVGTAFHQARTDAAKATVDPHERVECVSCHETPLMAASLTTAVPARVVHYVGGMLAPKWSNGYGTPIANKSCRGCHEEQVDATYVNAQRGLKVSHKEPLESNALCLDCHKPHAETGTVDRFTVGMDPCLRCHDAKVASADCKYCHVKDVGFAAKSKGVVKARSHDSKMACGACHKDQSTCDNCHGMRMPHTTEFMGAGHARPAVEDIWFNGGQACKKCHTDHRRPCAGCHNASFPAHPPSYMIKGHQTADPKNNGCDSCHGDKAWTYDRNFCGNCHPQWATTTQGGGTEVNINQ